MVYRTDCHLISLPTTNSDCHLDSLPNTNSESKKILVLAKFEYTKNMSQIATEVQQNWEKPNIRCYAGFTNS